MSVQNQQFVMVTYTPVNGRHHGWTYVHRFRRTYALNYQTHSASNFVCLSKEQSSLYEREEFNKTISVEKQWQNATCLRGGHYSS